MRRWSRARRCRSGTTASSPSGPARSALRRPRAIWPRAFDLPEDKVRVIVPDTGSGYGGKHTGDAAIEAARLAKAAGKPVKIVWTREEEFTWAYFRPAGVIDVRAGMTKDGKLTAWDFHNYNSGGSAVRALYDIADQRVQFHNPSHRCGRARIAAWPPPPITLPASATSTSWPTLAGIDPLEFRLKNLKDERLRAVLEAAAENFGWGKAHNRRKAAASASPAAPKKARYVATCAEVAVDPAQRQCPRRARRDGL